MRFLLNCIGHNLELVSVSRFNVSCPSLSMDYYLDRFIPSCFGSFLVLCIIIGSGGRGGFFLVISPPNLNGSV